MTSRQRSAGPPGSDGTIPPDPNAPTDEGPMRRELLRQIAHLDDQLSHFTRDNTPFEPLPPVRRRGPALLETASLEEIRDELVALREQLHERVVQRERARIDADLAPPRTPWWRRLF